MKIKTIFTYVFVLMFSGLSVAFAQSGVNSGLVSFEQNGKAYTTRQTNGHAMIGLDKKAIFGLRCSLEQDGRLLNVMIDLKKMGEFKPGKTVLSTMDDKAVANFAVFSDTGDGEASTKDITADSKTGTFTLTAVEVKGNIAVVSGSFEFSGKNSIEEGAEKNIAIKGSFENVQVRCLSPNLLKKH
ncbi:hypothetical protein SAMN05421820_10457 [Pedobacter steynii]|uniref:Lipid/polyisoprenoid-binding YceI-like domain-containing protein n=1 Tax=Pedobacter steynii TaxID=430522 RepID=A0A1G9U5G5_9SPHI|nr:hypothetical protein [Pedobacter steynii]NQX40653.1 hypothetical protein [Pedobacter steynii]SDM54815.1 hypothetical protein SAMN05421820_10457 [Pedobacter steynii]